MPMSPQERSALNAALTNAVDTLQAEMEAYRILLFVFLINSAGSAALRNVFDQARLVVQERTLLNVSPEEAARQRDATLAALESLKLDLAQVEHPPSRDAANAR